MSNHKSTTTTSTERNQKSRSIQRALSRAAAKAWSKKPFEHRLVSANKVPPLTPPCANSIFSIATHDSTLHEHS